MNIGIYARVSTPEQERHGHSIAIQIEKLRSYAKAKDYTIIKEYVDAAQSGAKLERPALMELIDDVNNHLIEGVLVYRLDRLSRSQKDTMYLIEDVFLKNNVAFLSIQESFDMTSPFGRATIGMLSGFAQLERDNIKDRLLTGRHHRASQGYYHGGGIIPFGYRYDAETNDLKRFKNEADVIRRMFELVSKGFSLSKVAKEVNSLDSTIKRRIRNRIYLGEVKFGGEWYKGKHEAIVSTELFELANAKMDAREPRTAFKRLYLLSGLIICGKCGNAVTAYESRSKHNGKEYRRAYYRCNSRSYRYKKEHGKTCDQPTLRVVELDNKIISAVKKLPFKTKPKKYKSRTADLKKKVDGIDSKIEKILNLYLEEAVGVEMYKKKLRELEKEKDKLANALIKARISDSEAVKTYDWINNIPMDEISAEAQREVLERVIDRIVIDDKNVDVFFK